MLSKGLTMTYCPAISIRHILFSIASIAFFFTTAQEIFSFDNCDLITCPLDCRLTLPPGEDCPACNCPLGQRCPHLNCPPEPMCLKVQRLDGCLYCACAGATYGHFDGDQNIATFVTNPSDLSATPKETCNLYDIQSVQRCMKELLSYVKATERTNPDVVAHPMVAMFLYSKEELLELCNLYIQSLRCVSTDTHQRCFDHERHMQMMISVFDTVCIVRQITNDDLERYLADYECVHNILVAHVHADQCSNTMTRQFGKAAKDDAAETQTKRQRKCEALNEFLDCVGPVINRYCGRSAADIFRFAILNATSAIAPECQSNGTPPSPVLFYIQQLPLPTLVSEKAVHWYISHVQPQISHWRRKHASFYQEIIGHFDSSIAGCECCSNVYSIAETVFSVGKLAWTPHLHIDYGASAIQIAQSIPSMCKHLTRLAIPVLDSTTCRDGLEFDSDY